MQAVRHRKASVKENNDLRAAVDEHAIVVIVDALGKITYVNDRFCTISKFSREELLGQDHRIIDSGNYPQEFARNLRSALTRRKIWRGEIKNRAKDGSSYWVETTIVPFVDDDGGPRQYIAIGTDITERKGNEEAQARLAAIVSSSEDAIISKDLDGMIKSWNRGAEKIFGYAAREIIGRPMLILFPADRMKEEEEILAQIRRGKIVEHFDTMRVCKGGRRIDVSVTISPIRDGDGEIVGASKIARDITSQKQAEAELREKERRLHLADSRLAEILNGMNEACFALDREWLFTFVNGRGETLLKHRREEILGNSIWTVFSGLVGTPMEKNYRRAMTDRTSVSFEAFSPIAQRWLDVRLFPSGDGLAAFLLDVHERKQAEEAALESKANLEAALANMTDAVFISDTRGRFVVFNNAFATFHRFKNMDECAKVLTDYTAILDVTTADGHHAPLEQWAVSRALRGETATNVEYGLRRKDTGESWTGSYSYAPIRNKEGTITGSVVVGRDITDRKRSEREISKQLKELQRWHEATLGREGRVLELKNEVNELLALLDQPLRYASPFSP